MISKYLVAFPDMNRYLTVEEIKENVINFEKHKDYKTYIGKRYIFETNNIKIFAFLDDNEKYIYNLYASIELNDEEKKLVTQDMIKEYNLELINGNYSIRCDRFTRGDLVYINNCIIGDGSLKTKEWLIMRLNKFYNELFLENEWQQDFFSIVWYGIKNFSFNCF